MKFCFANLWFAWLWMLLGFLSGMVMGMFFQREHWLGGYASFRRRLYRLGHVSFFGLGALNLFFYFTAQSVTGNAELLSIASGAMIAGGISMPLCCLVVAHLKFGIFPFHLRSSVRSLFRQAQAIRTCWQGVNR